MEKQKQFLTEKHNTESNELIVKFNKENELLQRKLQETQSSLDEINISKEEMQENLKRAFMRGVCALNFEAMNILQEKKTTNESSLLLKTNGLTQKILDINDDLNSIVKEPSKEFENSILEDQKSNKNEDFSIKNEEENSRKIVFFQAPKVCFYYGFLRLYITY